MRPFAYSFFALIINGMVILSNAADTLNTPIKDYFPFAVPVYKIAYARDLSSRIDVCSDSMLRMYDLKSNTLLKKIYLPSEILILINSSYSPDSSGYLIVIGDSGYCKVDIQSGQIRKCFPSIPKGFKKVICFSNNYSKIMYQGNDSLFYIGDSSSTPAKRCFASFGKKPYVYAAFSPDNKRIVTLNQKDSTLHIWDAQTDSILVTRKMSETIYKGIGFSNHGDKIVFTPNNKKRKYATVDASTGEIITVDSISLAGTGSWDGEVFIGFSSDDSKLMLGDSYSFTGIVDVNSTNKLLNYYNGPNSGDPWFYMERWFSASDTSAIILAYNTSIKKNVLYEISAKKILERYVKQDRPTVNFSGFSSKGEPLFIGSYSYTGFNSVTGVFDYDTTLYWNADTEKDFLQKTGKTQLSQSAYLLFENYFSPDGTRLFRESWHNERFLNYPMGITIFNIADTGQVVASLSGRAVISQDRKSACVFNDSSMSIVDAYTGEVTRLPFVLPPQWIPYAADPKQNIVCACSTYYESTNYYYLMRVWNFRTNEQISQFHIAASGKEPAYRYDMPRVLIVPGKPQVIIASNRNLRMFDFQTMAVLWEQFKNNDGILNATLTPDGNQFINGNCCYLTSTGDLLRVYQGMSTYYNFPSFNPVNNRHFIAGGKIWELPHPVEISNRPPLLKKSQTVQCYAGSRKMIIECPIAHAENAIVSLFQLNGRCIFKMKTMILERQSRIDFPWLGRGTYLYRFEVPSHSIKKQGKFVTF